MRLEFKMELDQVSTPRFSVESVEGIGKVFTLATLVLNVLETRKSVEIVFHGMSRDDPARKIEGFREIMESSPTARPVRTSRFPVGSSANSTRGSWTKARASATLCCSPPES